MTDPWKECSWDGGIWPEPQTEVRPNDMDIVGVYLQILWHLNQWNAQNTYEILNMHTLIDNIVWCLYDMNSVESGLGQTTVQSEI